MSRSWQAVCREPYRLFFPLGALLGLVGTGHWFFYGLGLIPVYSGHAHALIQTSLYMGCFVAGFLMTAVPRFSGTDPASAQETVILLGVFMAEYAAVMAGKLVWAEWCAATALVILAWFVIVRFRDRSVQTPPVEFIWIPFAFLHGIAGHTLTALGLQGMIPVGVAAAGRPMAELGMLLALVSGVGGFLGPRLMGIPIAICSKEEVSRRNVLKGRKRWVHLILAGILFASFCLGGPPAAAVRAAAVTGALIYSGALRLKKVPAPGLLPQLMAVSFWMIASGSWLAAFLPASRTLVLHLVFLGGFSLMTFGVATMVVLSHAGEGSRLERPLAVLRIVFWGVLAALAIRLTAPLFPDSYFKILAAAAAVWIATDLSWVLLCAPYIGKVPDPEAFESHHRQMKERMRHPC